MDTELVRSRVGNISAMKANSGAAPAAISAPITAPATMATNMLRPCAINRKAG